jgi:signal transduction histidine kinase
MLTQYALIFSITLHFGAAIIVISLIRATKYNSSWILLSIALFVMAVRRVIEYFSYMDKAISDNILMLNSWLGVIISLLMLVGMFYVKKVLNYLFKLEEVRSAADKRLLNTIIRTEESERHRLAKELHDGLGPLLSSAKLLTSALNESQTGGHEILKRMISTIDESIYTLKEISNNLSPHMLENFGLPTAIQSFIDNLEQTSKLRFEFRTNIIDQRYGGNMEIVLFRTVCELIHNTVKHADANKVLISLDEENDQLKLLYQDDGIGFDQEKLLMADNKGMGIGNIRSRISSLGGKFEIESWPDEGIIVTVELKIQDENKIPI